MIFKELTIENFGIYQGRHIVDLTVNKGKPIVLFGGLNGGGKTTFLDALQLVLYGKHAKCSNRGQQAYASFLSNAKNNFCDNDDIVELSLSFSHKVDTENLEYKVVRSWKVKKNGMTKDSIRVFHDGYLDEHLSQNWDEFVNEFIPMSLSGLFFFDGEKIEDLADPEKSAELVKTGIENLLGVDLLNQLHIDLGIIEKKRQVTNVDLSIIEKVSDCEEEIERQNHILLTIKKELAELEELAGSINIAINKARQKVRDSGAHLIEERDNIKFELGAIESKIKLNKNEQIKLAAGAGPLGLIGGLIKETKKQIQLENNAKQARVLDKAISEYELTILETLTKAKASNSILDNVKIKMADLSEERKESNKVECYLNCELSIFNGLDERIASERVQTRKLTINAEKLEETKALYEKKLETIPNYETVKHLLAHLSKSEGEHNGVQNKIKQTLLLLDEAESKSSSLATRYSNLLAQQNKNTFEQKRTIQVVEHINKLKFTLQGFGEKLIADNIVRLEALIRDKFLSLGRKKDLVSDLTISPETFEIVLLDSNQQQLAPHKLSAGERHLLAIAILWGLAKASGKQIPTVIDTPLGRLDSLHRTTLISKYFPKASQQVILLSTDEEIGGIYYDQLKSKVNREYHISYDGRKKSSSFEEGYF